MLPGTHAQDHSAQCSIAQRQHEPQVFSCCQGPIQKNDTTRLVFQVFQLAVYPRHVPSRNVKSACNCLAGFSVQESPSGRGHWTCSAKACSAVHLVAGSHLLTPQPWISLSQQGRDAGTLASLAVQLWQGGDDRCRQRRVQPPSGCACPFPVLHRLFKRAVRRGQHAGNVAGALLKLELPCRYLKFLRFDRPSIHWAGKLGGRLATPNTAAGAMATTTIGLKPLRRAGAHSHPAKGSRRQQWLAQRRLSAKHLILVRHQQ